MQGGVDKKSSISKTETTAEHESVDAVIKKRQIWSLFLQFSIPQESIFSLSSLLNTQFQEVTLLNLAIQYLISWSRNHGGKKEYVYLRNTIGKKPSNTSFQSIEIKPCYQKISPSFTVLIQFDLVNWKVFRKHKMFSLAAWPQSRNFKRVANI